MEESIVKKAEVLVEALPYIQDYQGKYFVLKMGGSLFRIPEAKNWALADVAFLKLVGVKCIIVCGGGPFISEEIQRRGKKTDFVDGLRVTDAETLSIVREVLHRVRDDLVLFLRETMKVDAAALEPEENCLYARKIHYQQGAEVVDLGFVGQVEEIDVPRIEKKLAQGSVLVLAPLAHSRDGHLYNINGDSVAAAIAEALTAEKLMFLTNVLGVMRNPENADTLISVLTTSQAESLISQNTIKGGMVPKVKSAISAIKKGVRKVHIISGNVPHAVLLEIFTDQGVGTEIIEK